MNKELIFCFALVIILTFQMIFKTGIAFAAGSSEVEILIEKAETFSAKGDYTEAKRIYLKALAQNHKNVRVRNNLGVLYMVLGDFQKALEQFEEILKLDPLYANAYENIGIILIRKFDYKRAAEVLKRALSLNPESHTAHYNYGLALIGLENYNEGISELKSAIGFNPSFSEAYSVLGEMYYRFDNVTEANESLKKAIAVDPENYSAYNTLGLISLRQAKHDAAFGYFNRALKGPRNVQVVALYNIALVHIAKKDADKAIEYLKKATDLEPGFAAAYNDWAMILIQRGNLDEAEKNFVKAISIEPKNRIFNFNLIDVYKNKKMFKEAIEICEYLIKLDAKNAQAYDELGFIHSMTGDGKRAKENYEKAIQANPAYAEAHYHLGVLYDKSGFTDKAMTEYRSVLKLNPGHVYAYNNIGFALMNNLKLDEAAVYLEMAVKLSPNFTFALYNLGIVYYNRNKGNDRPDARKLFMKIQEIEPKDSNFYKLAGDAIAQVDGSKK